MDESLDSVSLSLSKKTNSYVSTGRSKKKDQGELLVSI